MNTYQILMGMNVPNGYPVTTQQWASFIDIMDAIFDGYTISEVDGVWKGEHEQTKCVTVCTNSPESVKYIATKYKTLFKQDSVAIQTLPAMEFV